MLEQADISAGAQPAQSQILIVDLDGTLLRSDMLYESFWAAFAADWRTPFRAARSLQSGRSALKRELAGRAEIDVTSLPYDDAVIAYIKRWSEAGGRTALVTASDQTIAEAIAGHLGIFDEVHGSDGVRNLKGPNKAAFLAETFGAGNYAYMGDAAADLPVWQGAARAVTVNLPASLRSKVDALGPEVEHLETVPASIKPYIKALRPHQWLKNILVFLPMLAAHQFTGATFLQSLGAFIAFSLIASSVYVVNDLLDLKADRAHPRKCKRPFASGGVPIAHGMGMLAGLIGLGTLIAVLLGGPFFLAMVAYFVITTAYSLTLKRRVIIDICTLAGLYTMRIVAGAAATGIMMSVWLLAFSIFFFFSLAAIKRQAELVDGAARGKLKASGRGYHVDDLPMVSTMSTASGYVSILVLALYVNSPAVVELYSQPLALGGICCILLYWLSRIGMLTHRGHMDDDPVVFAARDRISQVCAVIMLGFAVAGSLL